MKIAHQVAKVWGVLIAFLRLCRNRLNALTFNQKLLILCRRLMLLLTLINKTTSYKKGCFDGWKQPFSVKK